MTARKLAPLALVPVTTGLALLLWQNRPPLPRLPASLTLPVTTTFVEHCVLVISWAALMVLLAMSAAYAVRSVRMRRLREPNPAIGRRRTRPHASDRHRPNPALPIRVAQPPSAPERLTGPLSLTLDLEVADDSSEPASRETATRPTDAERETADEPVVRVRVLGPFALDGASMPRRSPPRGS